MRIAVAIISRGRPLKLIGVVEGMAALASGKHEIIYGVRCDEDDPQTMEAAEALSTGHPILIQSGPRPATLGEAHNGLMAGMQGEAGPFGVFVSWIDRTFVVTPGWDEEIAREAAADSIRLMWWKSEQDPHPTHPVVPAGWYDACGGRVWAEFFPFWFANTWLAEVWELARGAELVFLNTVQYAGRRGRTQRLRDLMFWSEFYQAMRPMRVEEAARIRAVLGWPEPPNTAARVAEWEGQWKQFRWRMPEIERQFESGWEPDAQYLETRARAEAMMGGKAKA